MTRSPRLFAAATLTATVFAGVSPAQGIITPAPGSGPAPRGPAALYYPSAQPHIPTSGVGISGRNVMPVTSFTYPTFGGYYAAPSYYGYGYGYGGYPYYLPWGTPYMPGYYSANPYGGLVGTNVGPTPYEPPPVVYAPDGTAIAATIATTSTSTGSYTVPVSHNQAATLTVVLPTSGNAWLDGVKQKGTGPTFTLTSPTLKAGVSYEFDVRAEWTVDGTKYRSDRKMIVAAGDRQKLTLVSGDPVK